MVVVEGWSLDQRFFRVPNGLVLTVYTPMESYTTYPPKLTADRLRELMGDSRGRSKELKLPTLHNENYEPKSGSSILNGVCCCKKTF